MKFKGQLIQSKVIQWPQLTKKNLQTTNLLIRIRSTDIFKVLRVNKNEFF